VHTGDKERERECFDDLRVLFADLDRDCVSVCHRRVTCDDLNLRCLVTKPKQSDKRRSRCNQAVSVSRARSIWSLQILWHIQHNGWVGDFVDLIRNRCGCIETDCSDRNHVHVEDNLGVLKSRQCVGNSQSEIVRTSLSRVHCCDIDNSSRR
jgi:hypothetical protein